MNMLTVVTFAPLLGALIILCLPKEKTREIQAVAFAFAGISLIASLAMLPGFSRATHEMQFVERFAWIPSFGVQYFMGVDGLSFPLVLLTTFMCVIGLVGSLGIENRVKEGSIAAHFNSRLMEIRSTEVIVEAVPHEGSSDGFSTEVPHDGSRAIAATATGVRLPWPTR